MWTCLGMTRPKDEMGSQIVFSEFDISHPILVYLSRNNNTKAQARRFPALTAPEPEFPVIFGSKWDPLTSAWRQGGASPERLTEFPTGVSPLFVCLFVCSYLLRVGHSTDMYSLLQENLLGGKERECIEVICTRMLKEGNENETF